MTYNFTAKIYESPREQKTMIYRWGMNTYHISGMGEISEDARHEWTDRIVENVAKERNTSAEKGLLCSTPTFKKNITNKFL